MLKLRVKQVPYESKIAKAKAERKSARSLKNLRILSENSAEGLGSRRERCWGYVSSMRIHPKSCRIFPLKVPATLLSVSRKDSVGV